MKRSRILVFDFDLVGKLSSNLQAILESSPSPLAQLQVNCVRVCKPAFLEDDIPGVLSIHNPDIIFIVFHPSLSKHIGLLIQHLRREEPGLPVLIVIDLSKNDRDSRVFLLNKARKL